MTNNKKKKKIRGFAQSLFRLLSKEDIEAYRKRGQESQTSEMTGESI